MDWSKSEYLTQGECRCHCGNCGISDIDPLLAVKFAEIRTKYGKAIIVTSGCRCSLYNAVVGGARGSYHIAIPERGLLGQALDIKPSVYGDLQKLHKIVLEVMGETGGVILEPGWVHFDVRPKKYRATVEGKW